MLIVGVVDDPRQAVEVGCGSALAICKIYILINIVNEDIIMYIMLSNPAGFHSLVTLFTQLMLSQYLNATQSTEQYKFYFTFECIIAIFPMFLILCHFVELLPYMYQKCIHFGIIYWIHAASKDDVIVLGMHQCVSQKEESYLLALLRDLSYEAL